MQGQTRKCSLLEIAVNISIGYAISFVTNLTVLPLFGLHITVSDNLWIGLIYTVISICRGYALRRLFNAWHVRQATQ